MAMYREKGGESFHRGCNRNTFCLKQADGLITTVFLRLITDRSLRGNFMMKGVVKCIITNPTD